MKKEFLTDFGLTDEEAAKILAVVRDENQQLTEQVKDLKQQLSDKDTELTAAKESNIKYEADINDLKTTTAIKLALSGTAQDVDIAASQIDRSKIKFAEDGTLTGLDDQIQSLKESKGFLFKSEQPKGFVKVGAGKDETSEKETMGFREAIEAAISPNFN